MKGFNRTILHIFLLLSVFASGCFNTRFLNDNEKLFMKNKIVFENKKEKIHGKATLTRELTELSQLQPNQKLLGVFKTRLWFYNTSNQPKETKFRYWMKNKVGEPPVLYDSTLVVKSTLMMKNYLINKGFFYAKVFYNPILKNKKARVEYIIENGPRYVYDKIEFPIDSSLAVTKLIKKESEETVLKTGLPFDVNDLKQERERITDNLREEGYYLFNKEMVYYNLDSNDVKHTMDVSVGVNAPEDSLDHRKFYIGNIYIYTNFEFEQFQDTTLQFDTLKRGYYHFIYQNKLLFRPYTILTAIYFKKGDVYKKSDVQKTIFNLTDLGIFKFINVKFDQTRKDSLDILNCHIYLTPGKKQEITTTFELNNNTYNLLGLNLNLGYVNKNCFRGAERFEFDVNGGLETNFNTSPFFNTTDFSASASLLFNKFLIPFRIKGLAKSTRPKTRISLKFNYLTRLENFSIFSGNLNYGYEWRKDYGKHLLNIMSISLVRAPLERQSSDFQALLSESPSLRNSFSEQLIIGMNHTFSWKKTSKKDKRQQLFMRINSEMAGNLLNGISAIANINSNNTRPYSFLGINYAQFYKLEGDFRHYFDIKKISRLASRLFVGVGIPYANSTIMPYVKQYFAGGSVSLRGWTVRSLGPGSFNYRNSPDFVNSLPDQTGDIKLELNTELRFNMIKFIKGAVFIDAGNIWLAREDTTRPGANFQFNRFYKEFALGSGFGIRTDLSYFVLRFDVGFQIFDPTENENNKWVIKNINFTEQGWLRNYFKFNLALGYPF